MVFAGNDTAAGIVPQPSRSHMIDSTSYDWTLAESFSAIRLAYPAASENMYGLAIGFSLSPLDTRQAIPAGDPLGQKGGILHANQIFIYINRRRPR